MRRRGSFEIYDSEIAMLKKRLLMNDLLLTEMMSCSVYVHLHYYGRNFPSKGFKMPLDLFDVFDLLTKFPNKLRCSIHKFHLINITVEQFQYEILETRPS